MISTLKSYRPKPGDAIIFLAILMVLIVRVRLLDFPLERDEGEYAMMGQLILDGEPPYGSAFNMKYPGIYYSYAATMLVFGESVIGIRLGFLLLNLLTILLVWRVGTILFGRFPGAIAGATYALLAVSPNLLGISAHATHYVNAPLMLSMWIILSDRFKPKLKWLLAGIMLGLAILMKQHGFVFSIMGFGFALVLGERDLKSMFRRAALLTAGVAIPIALAFLSLFIQGVFLEFWYWTFEYAALYATGKSTLNAFAIFRNSFTGVAGAFIPIWIGSLVGVILVIFNRKMKNARFIAPGLLLFGALSTIPSMNFFAHHFITLLPGVAIGFAAFLHYLIGEKTLRVRELIVGVAGSLLLFSIWLSDFQSYFQTSPDQLSRNIYGNSDPINFVTSRKIGEYLKKESDPSKPILIIGAEPEICFYADRRPASPFIYVYGLMEVHGLSEKMQDDWIRYAEESDHDIVIIFPTFSWSPRWNSLLKIVRWTSEVADQYRPKAWLIRDEIGGTKWVMGKDALTYKPRDYNFILILERKSK